MSAQISITLVFIAAGAAVMFFSALSTGRIISRLGRSRYLRIWKVLAGLMLLFLFGYIGAILLILFDYGDLLQLLTGTVFFFGALFVYLVVRIGFLTINEDREIQESLQQHGARIERKLAARDQDVRTTEERYKLLVENSGLPILYIGLEGTLFFINEDGARLARSAPYKMIGSQLWTQIGQTRMRLLAAIRSIARSPEGRVFEVEVPAPGEGARRFLAVCRPIRSGAGGVIAVQVVAQDVTDRHEAEKKVREQKAIYDQILDNVGVDLALLDANLRYEYVNPRAVKDLEDRTWIVGKGDEEYAARKGRDARMAQNRVHAMRLALEENREIRFEERIPTPSGAVTHVLRVLTPIFDRAGRAIKIVAQGVDITEQKRVQEEMMRARDQAEEANRAKSEFLTNMSHEIRTPLNAVLGIGELLAETKLSDEQREFVQVSRKSGEHLLSLINDILDLSRIESGRIELERVAFDLAEFLERLVGPLAFRAREKQLDFSYEIRPHVPPILRGDPGRLRQILTNLVSNAVKFTDRGRVELYVEPAPGPGPIDGDLELVFGVQDTGPGIPPERQESIFDSFVQADSSTTRRFGGTGLGLAISRRLAHLLGGSIQLSSETGRGSRFTLRLPLTPAERADLPPPQTANQAADLAPGLDVLLVEDNPDNRLLIQAYLKKTPCRLNMAENGAEALESFRNRSFDIVLLDMQMPVMDGYTTAREMRSFEKEHRRPPTPIVALTANALKGEAEKCLAAGCDRHLSKPIQKSVLMGLLAGVSNKS